MLKLSKFLSLFGAITLVSMLCGGCATDTASGSAGAAKWALACCMVIFHCCILRHTVVRWTQSQSATSSSVENRSKPRRSMSLVNLGFATLSPRFSRNCATRKGSKQGQERRERAIRKLGGENVHP